MVDQAKAMGDWFMPQSLSTPPRRVRANTRGEARAAFKEALGIKRKVRLPPRVVICEGTERYYGR